MAVDTREKRNSSAVFMSIPELGGVVPDGSDLSTQAQRRAGLNYYSGIVSASITSGNPTETFRVKKPVDKFFIE